MLRLATWKVVSILALIACAALLIVPSFLGAGTLTGLESAAAIEVQTSRRIMLRNRSALSRLNG